MTLDQLEDQLVVALLPDVGTIVRGGPERARSDGRGQRLHGQVSLDEIDEDVRPVMLNVLNTGTTFSRVQRIRGTPGYFIHKDLYKTLARIRAREFATGAAMFRCLRALSAGRPPKAARSRRRASRSRITR